MKLTFEMSWDLDGGARPFEMSWRTWMVEENKLGMEPLRCHG